MSMAAMLAQCLKQQQTTGNERQLGVIKCLCDSKAVLTDRNAHEELLLTAV